MKTRWQSALQIAPSGGSHRSPAPASTTPSPQREGVAEKRFRIRVVRAFSRPRRRLQSALIVAVSWTFRKVPHSLQCAWSFQPLRSGWSVAGTSEQPLRMRIPDVVRTTASTSDRRPPVMSGASPSSTT